MNDTIKDALAAAKSPVVFLSGGVDSVLVLHLVKQVKDVPCIVFNQDFTKDQWKIIERIIEYFDIEVRTLPPARSYFIPNDELARVDEYQIGNITFPVVRDFIHSDRCSLDLDKKTLDVFPATFDCIFMGGLKSDTSKATNGSPFKGEVYTEGGITWVNPLWNMSKDEVLRTARKLGLPIAEEWYTDGDEMFNTGNLSACSACLTGSDEVFCIKDGKNIPTFKWHPSQMLEGFQKKFRFSD